jgi:uncharacterized membrane protein
MFLVQKKPTGKRSNLVWDIIFAATLGLLYLTRYISLPVIPMFLLAWWVRPFDMDDCIFRPSWKKIFRFGLIIFVIAAVFSPWVIGGISEGVPVKLMFGFGITARTNQDQLTAANLLMWAFLYICYIVLIAAPILPMLIKSISLIDCRDWRGEYGRWIFQGLLLIIGFLTAAIRHSWRAYYNQHFPSQIMGRYVVYFSAPFLITFFIVLELLEKTEKTNGKLSNKILVFISFLLVSFSYYVIIEGKIINIGRSFINPIGSVEGHYVNLLGINFFFFVAFIYLVSLIKLQHGNLRISFGVIAIGLAIFLIFGWFDYYEELKARQTYPWLSREIADLVKSSIPQDYLSNGITLYIPNSLNADQRAELYNGLRVRNIDNTQIIDFREGSDLEMATNFGFIISEFPVGEEPEKSYRFGEDKFYIELVTR